MVNPILFSSYPIPRVIPTQESSCCCNSKKWFKGNYLTPLCPEPDLGKKQIPVNTGNYASLRGFPEGSHGKAFACSAGDRVLIPGLGRSPGEGNGNPLQYACLENPMDRGAWQATVHGVTRVGYNLATKPPPP